MTTLVASACAGEDGVSYLTDLNDEAAGANCPSGGVKITTGPDDNGNGSLDADEVAQTKYVCGNRTLTDVVAEAPGTNCPAGGVKISQGADTNGDGTLQTGEATSTQYICGSAEAVVAKAFRMPGVAVNTGMPTTILGATIQAKGAGDILAIGSSDLFCTPTECPAGNPAASAYMWIADEANTVAPNVDYDFVYLQPNLTQSLTRTVFFPVTQAGAYTYNLRGQDVVGDLTFYRTGLTLVYLP
ncbi:MAG: hypothetical protein JNL83_06640 [Myxococcales bacterium]|nr:hypothetical protein [Myxococcales bacterium]